jgi:probable phosphoglycerate mutase
MTPPEGFRQHKFAPPPGATTVLLVRHGESAPAIPDEPFPLVDGHGDPPLHPEGRAQAERVATRLGNEAIDAIYVTTLQRTHQTAAPLAAALDITPTVEPDLREVFLGEWEGGLLRAKAAASDPLFARILGEERWDVIPGAEPADVFEARVVAGLRRIAAAHPDGVAVAVVHGGVIGQLLATASGSRPFAFSGADNGSISEIVVDGDRLVVRRFNDCAHL